MSRLPYWLVLIVCVTATGFASDAPCEDVASFLRVDASSTNAEPSSFTAPARLLTRNLSLEDVVQDSIRLYRFSTNSYAVRWIYTEAGAARALASWEADTHHPALSSEWKVGWFQHRGDKCFFRSELTAKEFMRGLKHE